MVAEGPSDAQGQVSELCARAEKIHKSVRGRRRRRTSVAVGLVETGVRFCADIELADENVVLSGDVGQEVVDGLDGPQSDHLRQLISPRRHGM